LAALAWKAWDGTCSTSIVEEGEKPVSSIGCASLPGRAEGVVGRNPIYGGGRGGASGLIRFSDWPELWWLEAPESRWKNEVNDFRLGGLAPITGFNPRGLGFDLNQRCLVRDLRSGRDGLVFTAIVGRAKVVL
jgi:hypothetical protein